jgi:hypothetical protein
MLSLVVHPACSGRSRSQGPLATRKSLLEMLSKVRGTATPRDQGPGAICGGESFSPCGFGLLTDRTLQIHSVF